MDRLLDEEATRRRSRRRLRVPVLRFEALGTAWQVREASAGELISVLYGPCVDAKKVALDPLPVVHGRAVMDLVSLGRERFVRTLTDEPEPSAPCPSAPCQSLPRVEAPAGIDSPEDSKETGTQMRENEEKWTEDGAARRKLGITAGG